MILGQEASESSQKRDGHMSEKLCFRCNKNPRHVYSNERPYSYCLDCEKKRKKEYHQRPEVKKHRKEYYKKYYQNPEVKARMREKMRQYYYRFPEKLKKEIEKSNFSEEVKQAYLLNGVLLDNELEKRGIVKKQKKKRGLKK